MAVAPNSLSPKAGDIFPRQTESLRLAAIVECSDDAIVSKTLDGIIQTWNAGAMRVFGYAAEEAIGKHITLIVPPDLVDEEKSILEKLRRGERIDHYETIRQAKDGRRIDVSLSVSPLRDADGNLVGASKIARDITKRKLIEDALRESESRHRFFADLAAATQPVNDPDEVLGITSRILADYLNADRCAYAEVDDDSNFVVTKDYSRDASSIVGRFPIETFGAEYARQIAENHSCVINDSDDDSRFSETDRQAYRAREIRAAIIVPLHKEKKLIAAMLVAQKSFRVWRPEEIGTVRTVVGRCWEMLERTRAMKHLRESQDRYRKVAAEAILVAEANAKFRAFFAQGTNFAGVLTLNGILVEANRLSLDACGFLREEVIGHPFWDCGWWSPSPELKELVQGGCAQARNGEIFRTETNYFIASGHQRVVELILAPVTDSTGRVLFIAATGTDVTDRRRMEDELRDADRKKDDFIALLGHELRNPLAPIRNGLQIMHLAGSNAAIIEQAREMMDRQLGHMVRLIDDLLDVARIGRNKMELRRATVLLSDVISTAVEAVRPIIEEADHKLTVTAPSEPIFVDADLTRLAQVFSNLLSNSAKYTNRGGNIALRAERHGNDIFVSVEDNGIGIPSESLPHIFDMFSQVDRSIERTSGGLGIGLALVKGLVEMHGGTVTAESAGSGCGSIFKVRLPAAVTHESEHSSPPSAGVHAVRSGRRILIVDDNEDSANSMGGILELLGNEVQLAHNGLDAIEIAEQFRPEVILMDLAMPRLNGYEAARRIRQRPWGGSVVIVALTGWGQEADKVKSRNEGFDDHLVKPVSLPDLENVLGAYA